MELSRIELEHLQNRIDVVCSGRKIPGITGSHGTGNIELEALFNQYTPTGRTHMLNTFILGRVLSSLRNNGFECVEPIEYLAIQPTGAGISIGEHVNIRVVIESMEHVQAYCLDDSLVSKPAIFMLKKRYTDGKIPPMALELRNYAIRVNLKQEETLDISNPLVARIIQAWPGFQKHYRYFKRWQFITADRLFRFDVSLVRQTDSRSTSRRFVESGTLDRPADLEIELEYIGPSNGSVTADIVRKGFVKYAVLMQRIIQNSHFILPRTRASDVLYGYFQLYLTPKSWKDYLELMADPPAEFDPATRMQAGVEGLGFLAPQPITLELKNLRSTCPTNILSEYCVTEKADGDRVLIYVHRDGRGYAITSDLQVTDIGVKFKDTWIGSIFDAEWIRVLKNGSPANLIELFDVYWVSGRDVRDFPFMRHITIDEKTTKLFRHQAILAAVRDIERIHDINSTTITAKQYRTINGTSVKTIWDACSSIFQAEERGEFPYTTDGLIFQPIVLGIGQTKRGDAPADFRGGRWESLFKWKPAELNTIDFLLRFQKDETTGRDKIQYSTVNGRIIQYRIALLFVGFPPSEMSKDIFTEFMMKTYLNGIELRKRKDMIETLYIPTSPYDAHACYMNLPTEMNSVTGVMESRTQSGELIENGMIIEFSYNINASAGWRWIPNKIRYDKTEKYRKGDKTRTMNLKWTADNVWQSIHSMITKNMLASGKDIPDEIDVEEELEHKQIYYAAKVDRKETGMISMANFHNNIIKGAILINNVTKPGARVLDLACGKGGDLSRWLRSRVAALIGIDIADDNIFNKDNGIYQRAYSIYQREFNDKGTIDGLPVMAFAVGNAAKNLRKLEGTPPSDLRSQNVINTIFGNHTMDKIDMYPALREVYKIGDGKFDVVSCMFALHYFFADKETLDGFMQNVKDNLKPGGYFIGCCLDGKTVLQRLQDIDVGEFIYGATSDEDQITSGAGRVTDDIMTTTAVAKSIDDISRTPNIIWSIRRDTPLKQLPDSVTSLGQKIGVLIESIGAIHEEYLVNFDYFVDMCAKEYGLHLLTPAEARELDLERSTGLFRDAYQNMIGDGDLFEKYGNLSTAEKQYSFMNRWFIFRNGGSVKVTNNTATISAENSEKQPTIAKKRTTKK